jgi:hypothetical protein
MLPATETITNEHGRSRRRRRRSTVSEPTVSKPSWRVSRVTRTIGSITSPRKGSRFKSLRGLTSVPIVPPFPTRQSSQPFLHDRRPKRGSPKQAVVHVRKILPGLDHITRIWKESGMNMSTLCSLWQRHGRTAVGDLFICQEDHNRPNQLVYELDRYVVVEN